MRSGLPLLASLVLSILPAGAQTSNYTSARAETGKATKIWTVSAIKKDCSIGQIGGVKVLAAPKSGMLSLVRGKMKSPATFRCPNLETPVEMVVYKSQPKFTGSDEVVYETKSADGIVERHTIKIEVSDKPGAAPKKDGIVDL